MNKNTGSRIPSFYKLTVSERIRSLYTQGLINEADFHALSSGGQVLPLQNADRMIENVIGIMGLPMGLALNFLINDKDWVIPMVVEEPSIVAGLSSAAKVARISGGFKASYTGPILIGQIQLLDLPDFDRAWEDLLVRKQELLQLADELNPKMVDRGGGARDLELRRLDTPVGAMLVIHLLVDTRDAMGANMINTTCEGLTPLVETITGGRVLLRILSNLTDQAVVRSSMKIHPDDLAVKGFSGVEVRDGIVSASHFAAADPYRAATHNKGIMNGVDALAIAVGNDWRAIEAAAHAYAARKGRYSSLSHFCVDPDGFLIGELEMPMKVGTVAGNLKTNPAVALNMRILNVHSAEELAQVMGCVGLAQNFAALKALATEGIQRGHMSLHARNVAVTAEIPSEHFDVVIEKLIASGEVKAWKAKEILADIKSRQARQSEQPHAGELAQANGKVILLGEHAAVYNRRVLAAPLPLAISASAGEGTSDGVEVSIPKWGIDRVIPHRSQQSEKGLLQIVSFILEQLDLVGCNLSLKVTPHIPLGVGLGSSAALAVAIIRALVIYREFDFSDDQVNALAYQCEQIAHGTPSGIDNTVATYGRFVVFQKQADQNKMTEINPAKPLPLVIAQTGIQGSTMAAVNRIRQAWQGNPKRYETVFDHIDDLTQSAGKAIEAGDLAELGELMNLCQGDLNALQVSSPEIETLIQIARQAGALGAKLTGGGIGGSIVVLCQEDTRSVAQAIRSSGYQSLEFTLE